VWRLFKKLKIELPCDPAIPLLGIYLKECELGYNEDIFTPILIAALFTIANYYGNSCYVAEEGNFVICW
jgi:hypothetical protein